MPCMQCTDGKWKWGETGSCEFDSEEECHMAHPEHMDEKAMKPRLIYGKKEDVAEIAILGPIGGDFWTGEGITATQVKNALDELKSAKKLTLTIDSPGGAISEGVAIYNMLHMSGLEITANVVGWAASAASVVLMAADKRMIGESSMVMIHEGWAVSIGNKRQMREIADVLDQLDAQMAGIYASRSGKPIGQFVEWMAAETWFPGQEAINAGLADGLIPNKGAEESEADLAAKALFAKYYKHGDQMMARYRDLCGKRRPESAHVTIEDMRMRFAALAKESPYFRERNRELQQRLTK